MGTSIWDGTAMRSASRKLWDGGAWRSLDATATTGLPWALDYAALKASPKKLFAHYFQTFPISVDNAAPATDYYQHGYMLASGESGAHAAEGGYLRDRPQYGSPQHPLSGDYVTADAITDIQQAIAGGIDGFLCDVMSTGSKGWTFYQSAFAAANANFPNFYVIPMIDTGGSIGGYTASQISDAIYAFSQGSAAYYLADGRMFVSSFHPEAKALAWWQAIFADLQTRHGINAAFLPAYLNIGAATTYAGQPWTYGSGYWGDGSDPQIQAGATDQSVAVKGRGEKFMYPIQGQNIRNYSSVFDEADGTAALREAWVRALTENPDCIQYVTWNDYSEGGEYNNSVAGGLTQLDISTYYLTQWKLGSPPAILRDAVYLAHRNQIAGTTPSGGQTSLSAQWVRTNRMAVQNIVEVLTFLTDSATVTVTIGGVDHTYTAPAGMNAQTYPLAVGAAPSVTVTRNGTTTASVTSPAAVLSAPVKDDYQYFRASSLRGTTGQFDPQVVYGY